MAAAHVQQGHSRCPALCLITLPLNVFNTSAASGSPDPRDPEVQRSADASRSHSRQRRVSTSLLPASSLPPASFSANSAEAQKTKRTPETPTALILVPVDIAQLHIKGPGSASSSASTMHFHGIVVGNRHSAVRGQRSRGWQTRLLCNVLAQPCWEGDAPALSGALSW